MNAYNFLQDPNLFLETMAQIPNAQKSSNNNFSKTLSNFTQSKQKLNTIKTIHENTHTIIKNGRQVGMTTLITLYIVYYCLTNTNKKILIYAAHPNLGTYHNIILQTLNHLNFVHSYNFNYSSKSNSLIEVNSNKILISNNSNSIKGTGLDFVYLDDFAYCSDDVTLVSYLIPLLQYTKGKFVISSNPSSKKSMFNDIYLNSNYFKKVDFPNTSNNISKTYLNHLDKEEYNIQINAKVYPNHCNKNNIMKYLNGKM